jgi:hypothetical protein
LESLTTVERVDNVETASCRMSVAWPASAGQRSATHLTQASSTAGHDLVALGNLFLNGVEEVWKCLAIEANEVFQGICASHGFHPGAS